ncbi:MAG: carbohydrate-binding domain-containing protein [Erysipelotrichaceae bacterium]|nr:carbohydrate-binding domain-containing protein [Erysipelotrichaceae bacterium]
MRKLLIILGVISLLLMGCSSQSTISFSGSSGSTYVLDTSDMFTDRDLETDYDEYITISLDDENSTCDDDTVSIEDQIITITSEGIYYLTGTLSDGWIIIDVDDNEKVQLILDNVSITHESNATIYVKEADKVFITLADNSENTLISKDFETVDDDNIDGTIFSKSDLTLNGNGTLNITSTSHGIVSKDDLVITSGTYNIDATKQGLSGKDSIRIKDGTFNIVAGGDGLHSENSDDEEKGYIYIEDGTFVIEATGDGISASYVLQIDGGTFDMTTGGGSSNASTSNQWGQWNNQTVDDTSAKGIKSSDDIVINDGTFAIDSSDDSIHTNGNLTINGGTFEITSGDDGMHADIALVINDGDINITQSYEGIEGQSIDINGGTIVLVASDDGLNASGGNDSSSQNRMGANDFAADEDAYINITDGSLTVDSEGDGIDSNGYLYMSGGTVYVDGPTNSADGAIDYNGSAYITGGTIIAVGASGMAENFSEDSTQGCIMISISSTTGDVILQDSSGNTIISYSPTKSYSSVLISTSELSKGSTYTLITGNTSTEITLSSLIYTSSTGMSGGMNGGMNNGKK